MHTVHALGYLVHDSLLNLAAFHGAICAEKLTSALLICLASWSIHVHVVCLQYALHCTVRDIGGGEGLGGRAKPGMLVGLFQNCMACHL